jgi:long-chain acyl-CoA synthetase
MLSSHSLHRALFSIAAAYPDNLAIQDAQSTLTYSELIRKINAVANGLRAHDLRAGEPVILALPNSAEFMAAHFGILTAGGVSVLCSARIPQLAFYDIANRLGVRLAIAKSDLSRDALLGESGSGLTLIREFNDETSRHATVSERGGEDVAAILFTTGSTGTAKGVFLSHKNTSFTVGNLISMLGYTSQHREVVTLPLSHSFGLGQVYCNLFSGGSVYIEDGPSNIKRVLEKVNTFRATSFPGTPSGFGLLIDHTREKFEQACVNVRLIVINSEKLYPARMHQLQQLLPNAEIFVYYGLTEASRSTLISLTKSGPSLYESVGCPMDGVEVAIDPATSEILIRGPHVAKNYLVNSQHIEVTDRNGWLHTGDRGRLDDENRLFLIGRIKEQINVSGYKVDPIEVEQIVCESGIVLDAAVCGMMDIPGVAGEAVVCGVVLESKNNSVPVKDIRKFCASRLEYYKIPLRWVSLDSIPRFETGKINREELKRILGASILPAPENARPSYS